MDYNKLIFEKSGEVATVTFSNPKLFNAIDEGMMKELADVCSKLEIDADTRFVIFTGAGKHFIAGADMRQESAELDPDYVRMRDRQGQEFVRRMLDLEQITIAAVNGGICYGAGVGIAIACDLRIASQTCRWSVPHARFGLFFTWIPMLVSIVGAPKAKELLLTCDEFSSDEALSIGLVNKVVPPEQLMDATHEMVEKIAAQGPLAVRITKKLVNAAKPAFPSNPPIPELIGRLHLSTQPIEGGKAFFEKRKPHFDNRPRTF